MKFFVLQQDKQAVEVDEYLKRAAIDSVFILVQGAAGLALRISAPDPHIG